MPEVSISGIEFKIKGSTDAASDSIDKLTGKLGELRTALKQASGTKSLANGLNALRNALNDMSKANTSGIKKTFSEIAKAAKPLENISNVSKNMASFMRGLAKLSENPEGLSDVTEWLAQIAQIDFSNLEEAGEGIRNIASAAKDLAGIGKIEPQTSGVEEARHGLLDFFSTARMTTQESSNFAYALDSLRIGLLGIAKGAANAARGLLKLAMTGAKGVLKAMAYPFQTAAKSVGNFASKIKELVGSFKRILMYRMVRSIIKDIGKAMEEGAKAAYLFSKNLGDKTKYISKMLDSLSASSKGLGGQMGAAWASLLAAITPIINQIIAIISRAIQVITQFFALLGGSGFYLKAKQGIGDWANETARGAGAAKEWKNQLMGFDELNRLNDPSNGGGGGGSDTDYGSLFEEVPVEQGVKDFFDSLKAAFDTENWQQLGTLIGDKINDVVNSIDWAGIGSWVGEKINALFTTEYWTLKTINFQNIGAKIAEFLNSALENIDFSNLGGIIAEHMTIVPDLLIGAITNLDFKLVGKSIGDTIKGAFNNLGDWAANVDWSSLGTSIVNGLIDFFTGLDVAGIIQSAFSMFDKVVTGLAEGIGSAFKAVGDAIKEYFQSNNLWTDVKNAFASKWNSFAEWANQYLPEKFQLKTIPIDVEPNIVSENVDSAVKKIKKSIETASEKNPANITANANIKKYTNKLKNDKKPVLPSVANLSTAKNNLVKDKKPIIPSLANILGSIVKGDEKGRIGVKANADIQKVTTGGRKFEIDVTGKVTDINIPQRANGGLYSRGTWHSIQQYASGGMPRGSQLFWARESGPELVGTLGGGTAVMNNDQIVSSVSAGVARAISSIQFHLTGLGSPVSMNTDNGENEDAMYRAFKRALDETDFDRDINLDGQKVYRAMVRRNRMNTAATGANAFA